MYRTVGTGISFISAFANEFVLYSFQYSSIFCSVLAQTVYEPFLSSKCGSEWRGKIKFSAAIFCPPFNLVEKIILAIIL